MATDGYSAFQRPAAAGSEFNALAFLIQSMIGRIATATLVQVQAVTNAGGVSPVGFVDILPMVNQIDGAGVATQHLTIFRCPYLRLQGGANAVILDPQVGDIGIALFADRDISSATANKAPSNPGSARRFDMADGLYLGGVLNGAPSQYVQFSAAGIKLHSPTAVILEAPDIQLNGSTVEINATTSATVTTPTFTVNGATVLNGTVVGSSTITAPNVIGTTDVTFGSKSGIAHEHDHGTIAASGHTGVPL